MSSFIQPITMTIPISTAVSNAIELDDKLLGDSFVTVYVVRTTGAWTTATLGVQGSVDNTTFYPIRYEDNTYAGGSVDASDYLAFVVPAFPYIRLWSHDGAGSDVTQGAAESFQVVLFPGQRMAERTFTYSGLLSGELQRDVQVASADGAITIQDGIVHITKGTAAALTLADPADPADNGKVLRINASTAAAHTVDNSAGSGFNGGGASSDVGTFGGAIGDGFEVYAYAGVWWVTNNLNVTLA